MITLMERLYLDVFEVINLVFHRQIITIYTRCALKTLLKVLNNLNFLRLYYSCNYFGIYMNFCFFRFTLFFLSFYHKQFICLVFFCNFFVMHLNVLFLIQSVSYTKNSSFSRRIIKN